MKIIGLYGGQDADGMTATLVKTILEGAKEADITFIDLNDYQLTQDRPNQPSPALDELEALLAEADVWVLGTPTYYGTVAGQFKLFFDYFRHRMIKMNSVGDSLPGKYKDKHYVSVTSCFATAWDNTFTHQTDPTFRMIDKAMTTAGLHKVTELVLPNTWQLHGTVPAGKLEKAKQIGASLTTRQQKDDETMKRYVALLGMIAVIALATMGLQQLVPVLTANFWWRYLSFVGIFFVLLAGLLHWFTFMRHKRR